MRLLKKRDMRLLKWAAPAVLVVVVAITSARPDAADTVIRGVITDPNGKPVRGALIKASMSGKSVSRYTGEGGRYELTVPPGTYDVSAEAYGYAAKRQQKNTTQEGAVNFMITPNWTAARLTGADIDHVLGDSPEAVIVRTRCIQCHSLDYVLRKRGSTAAQWKAYIEGANSPMARRMGHSGLNFSPAASEFLTAALEKLFGPNGQYFGPDADPPTREQVQHPAVAPETIKATFREYAVPNSAQTMPHSLAVGLNGEVWFSGWDAATNAVIRFDPVTEKFQTYTVPTASAEPHTPCVSSDSRVWMPLNARGPAKFAVVDLKTNQLVEHKWPERMSGTHNCREDKDGNIWFAALGEKDEGFYRYDVKTDQWRAFKYHLPASYPANSRTMLGRAPTDPMPNVRAGLYDMRVDSHGKAWGAVSSMGMIVSVDPKTGAAKEYFPPNHADILGLEIDAQDNVWFGGYAAHKLVKLDPKTGQFKSYQPPTAGATPYGFAFDKRTGYIWYSDLSGNNITRFDPKTEKFVEYPFPSRNVDPRLGIGIDPQGRIWFTEFLNGVIGVLDPGDKLP